jgi:hypothetical protein
MLRIGSLWSRPTLYYNIDGVGELVFGLFLFGCALLSTLEAHTRLIWFAVLVAVLHFGSKAIKTHITYPRTGFVEYRRRDRFWAGWAGAVIGVACGFATGLHWDWTIPARLIGPPFAAVYACSLARMFPWKWAVVALMAAGSLAIALRTPDPADALLLNCLVYGTILLAAGGVTFWLYLRRTQPPAQEAQ